MVDEKRASEPPPPPSSERPSEVPPDDDGSEESARRRRLERVVRDTLRRAIEKGLETGLGTLSKTDKAFRTVVDDVKLPREVASFLFSSVEDTKNVIVRTVAREVREFLEHADLSTEIQRVLTSLSFEIKTEIRFIPNESGVKPKVRASVAPKIQRDSEPPEDRKSQPPDEA